MTKRIQENEPERTFRLWSFQRADVPKLMQRETRYCASWEHTPRNWRVAYEWMARELQSRKGLSGCQALVWCWHSCRKWEAGPTVEVAESLLSDWDREQGLVTVELIVPEQLSLLSSYRMWNELLDVVHDSGSLPSSLEFHESMFEEPLLRDEEDNVQAVLPYIESAWIVDVRPLSLAVRHGSELV